MQTDKVNGKIYIYSRFSSDMQRTESCPDQERKVKEGLARLGIDCSNVELIRDEAVTGTKDDRAGLNRLTELVNAGQVAILAVDDQARLSRGINVQAFIADLVFHKGRFISVGENIDTSKEGWELLVGVMQLHHSASSKETGRRVRRGCEGRFLEKYAVGSFPYGYRTEFVDSNWAEQLAGRKKPKKRTVKYAPEAAIVHEIFERFANDKWSMNAIAADMNRRCVPKGTQAKKSTWHCEFIREILNNKRYIGQWAWGVSESVRNSRGKKRRQKATRNTPISVEHPELRIIEQELWERAKAHQLNRARHCGFLHPRHVAPFRILSGLLHCGTCGRLLRSTLVTGTTDYYIWCPNWASKTCTHSRKVKPDTVRRVLIDAVLTPLKDKFPGQPGFRNFTHGRLHSFRHFFCSKCATDGVAEQVVMRWLGHTSSRMVQHYYHLHDDESQRQMNKLTSVGGPITAS